MALHGRIMSNSEVLLVWEAVRVSHTGIEPDPDDEVIYSWGRAPNAGTAAEYGRVLHRFGDGPAALAAKVLTAEPS